LVAPSIVREPVSSSHERFLDSLSSDSEDGQDWRVSNGKENEPPTTAREKENSPSPAFSSPIFQVSMPRLLSPLSPLSPLRPTAAPPAKRQKASPYTFPKRPAVVFSPVSPQQPTRRAPLHKTSPASQPFAFSPFCPLPTADPFVLPDLSEDSDRSIVPLAPPPTTHTLRPFSRKYATLFRDLLTAKSLLQHLGVARSKLLSTVG
jgi:hypothetical protein